MPEPMSSSAAAGAGGVMAWKAAGGAAGVAAGSAVLAGIVVMSMTLPKDSREWTVGLISTVVSSLSVGSYAGVKLGVADQILSAALTGNNMALVTSMAIFGGVIFACGLPGWFVVRSAFRWMHKRQDKDLGQIVREVHRGTRTDS